MPDKRQSRRIKKQQERNRDSAQRTQKRQKLSQYLAAQNNQTQLNKESLAELLHEPPEIVKEVFTHWMGIGQFYGAVLPVPFPKTYAVLGAPRTISLNGLENNLRLALALLELFSAKLSGFIAAYNNYTHYLISGAYSKAEEALSTVIKSHGVSLWTLEAELLIKEKQSGLKGNREFVANIQKQANDWLVQYLASHLTQRVESGMSVSAYEAAFANSLPQNEDIGESVAIMISDVRFRLSPHSTHRLEHLSYFLTSARTYSLCDLYLTFQRVLQVCIAREDAPISRQAVTSIIRRCASVFRDDRFSVMLTLLDPKQICSRDDIQDNLFRWASEYSIGNYRDVISQATLTITNDSTFIDLFELIAYSAANAKTTIPAPFTKDSLGNDILKLMHSVLCRDGDTGSSLERLLKHAYVLDCTSVSHWLMAFYVKQRGSTHYLGAEHLSALNSKRLSPRSSMAFSDHRLALNYLNECDHNYPNNVSVRLFQNYLAPRENDRNFLSTNLTPYRAIKYQAAQAELAKKHEAAASLFRDLMTLAEGRGTVLHDGVCGIVRNLTRINRIRDAADVIVDAFIKQPDVLIGQATNNIDTYLKEIAKEDFPRDERTATTSLLIIIAVRIGAIQLDSYSLFVSYDECLFAHNCTRPTQLIDKAHTFSQARLNAFFRYVCVTSVMRLSYHIRNTDDLENERLQVLQYLLSNEPHRKSETESEIADLTKRATLRAAVKQVESSRLYVNTAGIRQFLQSEHAQTFERYIQIREITDEDLRRQILKFEINNRSPEYADMAIQLFSELFIEVRDRFVSSKADGLDTYLSMRVRHGHLSAQLRSQFEQLNLVTRHVEADGKYARNEYWANRLSSLNGDVIEQVDNVLRELSESVDRIIDEVNSEWIRISLDPFEQKAMFNYFYSVTQLVIYYYSFSGITDHDEFVDLCFQHLWNRTEVLLEGIRSALLSILRPRLTEAVTLAESRLDRIHPEIQNFDLKDRIASCRTNIQNDVNRVADWFTTSSLNVVEAFDFALLVETAAEIVRRVHQEVQFKPECNLEEHKHLDGMWFNAYVDVMFILFDNVVRHTHATSPRCIVKMATQGHRLIISVSNILSAAQISTLSEKVDSINRSFGRESVETKLQTEGGTGFVKLNKLLRQDLRQSDPQVQCTIRDENLFQVEISMPLAHIRTTL